MTEGIFTASASKQKKIFSQVTKAKKEIFKNASETKPAVKEEKDMPSFQQLRTSLEEKTLTPAEKTKREEIAKAMERENPGMPMAKKMAIATAQAKKVAEELNVSEGASGTKPGWMLKQDPALAKKVKDSKAGHQALKKWAGKIVPKDDKQSVKEASDNPCWDGYKMLGMKDKDGKKVPNCIPEEQHYCAKHVYSNMFGEGTVVEGIHAEPDDQGNVEWYAVQFNEGVKKVFTEKLEIMMAEFHGNHKKKRMTNGR